MTTPLDPTPYLNTREAAALVGVAEGTIRIWVHRGKLTPSDWERTTNSVGNRRMGQRFLFHPDDVRAAAGQRPE